MNGSLKIDLLKNSIERRHRMVEDLELEDSSTEEPDKKPVIEAAKNFDELYDTLKKVGGVIGSEETRYAADGLIGRIRELREGLKEVQEKGKIRKLKALTQESVKELIWKDENLKMLICQITRTEELRSIVVKLGIDEIITKEISRDINDNDTDKKIEQTIF